MKKYLIIASVGAAVALVSSAMGEDDAWHSCFDSTHAALEAGDSLSEAFETVAERRARHLKIADTKKRQLRYFEQHEDAGHEAGAVALAAATFTTRMELGEHRVAAEDTGDTLGCLEDIGDGPLAD